MHNSIRVIGALSAVAMFLTIVGGCSKVGRAERNLDDEDPVVRAAAAESLGVWGIANAGPNIRPLLGDSIPGVRERAAESLGRIGDSAAVGDLIRLALTESDVGVRWASAGALAATNPDSAAEAFIPYLEGPTASLHAACALTDLIRVPECRFRSETLLHIGWALGGIVQSAQAERGELPGNWHGWDESLRGVVAPEDTAEIAADQAAVGLAWLGGEAAGRGLLLALRGTTTRMLRDSLLHVLVLTEDTLVTEGLVADTKTRIVASRKRAIERLGGLPNARALEAVIRASGDRLRDVRAQAWASLLLMHGARLPGVCDSTLAQRCDTVSAVVVDAAKKALTDADPAVAAPAAALLFRAGDPRGVTRLVEISRTHPSWLETTCYALGDAPLDDGAADHSLVGSALVRGINSRDSAVRVAAIRALRRWDIRGAKTYLQVLVSDADPQVARAALRVAGERKETSILAEIITAFGAAEPVRSVAARAAANIVDAQSVNYLVIGLTQLERRRGAVEAVGALAERVAGTADALYFADALARASAWLSRMVREEPDPADRIRALWALGFIPSDVAVDGLRYGLGDALADVREEAAIGLARRRPELAAPSLRTMSVRGGVRNRLRAVRALASIPTELAHDAVVRVSVVDPSPEVRSAARQSIAPPGGSPLP